MIRIPQVTVIDDTGKNLGVLPTDQALRLAQERGLDLVEVAPNARPPVCKILDYGAYQYRLEKAERKQKVKQKRIEVKGVRLTFKIGEHDLAHRVSIARKFLDGGDKVKIEMILRGRENAHRDYAEGVYKKFLDLLGGDIAIETPLSRQGNRFSLLVGKKA